MPPFPVNSRALFTLGILLAGASVLAPSAARAQQQISQQQAAAMSQQRQGYQQQPSSQQQQMDPATQAALMQQLGMAMMGGQPGLLRGPMGPQANTDAFSQLQAGRQQIPEQPALTQKELDRLLQNSDSPQAKANALADKRKRQRDLEKTLGSDAGDEESLPPPQDLQDIEELGAGESAKSLSDASDEDTLKADAVLDLRRDAQKEAALSFGARGGLAKRNYEIMERLKGFESTLDQVFNFRALLVHAPSGLLIEPPIVREADNSLVVTQNGDEAAVADRIYDINKQAKIVTAPRDWRLYLVQSWITRVPRPPRLLWPKDAKEREAWKDWVNEGWRAGAAQADAMFEANLARLVTDYKGMVRYRMLLTQGMISQPYAMHEDRGVTGTKTVMRVGDRALRLTGPSQFLTGSDLWKPADR
jgi:defect-in-organelle-trafficking protein DotC